MKLTIRRIGHNLTDAMMIRTNEIALTLFGHCEEYEACARPGEARDITVGERRPFSLSIRRPGARLRYSTPALEIILST